MMNDRVRVKKMPAWPKTDAVSTDGMKKMPAYPKTAAVSTGLEIKKMPAWPAPPTAPAKKM